MNSNHDGATGHLSSVSISDFWLSVSESLKRLLEAMDSREDWTVDSDQQFINLLGQLVELFDNDGFVRSLDQPANSARMAEVLALTQTSRFMRLLEMFDKRKSGVVSRLVLSLARVGGEASIFADLFYERILMVNRGEMLGQIFSKHRGDRIASDVSLAKEVSA